MWTSCGGETPADEGNLGPVSYTPMQGFPGQILSFVACHAEPDIIDIVCVSGYYYPYLNQMHYLSPIIWLQFRNLTPGVIIQIRWIHESSALTFAKILQSQRRLGLSPN